MYIIVHNIVKYNERKDCRMPRLLIAGADLAEIQAVRRAVQTNAGSQVSIVEATGVQRALDAVSAGLGQVDAVICLQMLSQSQPRGAVELIKKIRKLHQHRPCLRLCSAKIPSEESKSLKMEFLSASDRQGEPQWIRRCCG